MDNFKINKIEMIKLNNLKVDSGYFTTKPKKIKKVRVKNNIRKHNYCKVEDKIEDKVENEIEDKVEDENNKESNVGKIKEGILGFLIGIPLSLAMMYVFGYLYINYVLTL